METVDSAARRLCGHRRAAVGAAEGLADCGKAPRLAPSRPSPGAGVLPHTISLRPCRPHRGWNDPLFRRRRACAQSIYRGFRRAVGRCAKRCASSCSRGSRSMRRGAASRSRRRRETTCVGSTGCVRSFKAKSSTRSPSTSGRSSPRRRAPTRSWARPWARRRSPSIGQSRARRRHAPARGLAHRHPLPRRRARWRPASAMVCRAAGRYFAFDAVRTVAARVAGTALAARCFN